MVWETISLGDRTELVHLDHFPPAENYVRNVLELVAAPYAHNIGPNFMLMHDNATPHAARGTRNSLEKQKIRVSDWSTQTPVLSSFQVAWDMFQGTVLQG